MPHPLTADTPARLLLTTDAVGGVWRYSLDLAAGLARAGVTPLLAVLGPAPSLDQRAEAADFALVHTGLPLDWTADSPAVLAANAAELQALAARLRASSVHLHAPALAGATPWTRPVVAVAHSCVSTWWRAVRGGDLPPDFAWRHAATSAGLHIADRVIAPTHAHAVAVRAAYGPIDIDVVHNGATRVPSQSRQRGRAPAILTAGRLWDDAKNAAALDAVAPRLAAPIRAAGPTAGPNGASITLPNLHCLGSLDPAAMQAEYAASTVFASLARYEPFGLSVLEAALAGMRLVLSDIPTFRELWSGAALFVPTGADPLPALEAALATPGDPAAARARRYTLDRTVAGTLAVHRRIGALVPA